jgi:hypothetical protein
MFGISLLVLYICGFESVEDNQKKIIKMKKFKVYKVGRKSGRRSILRRDLTEAEAQRVVKSYPNSSRSMVCYTAQ